MKKAINPAEESAKRIAKMLDAVPEKKRIEIANYIEGYKDAMKEMASRVQN